MEFAGRTFCSPALPAASAPTAPCPTCAPAPACCASTSTRPRSRHLGTGRAAIEQDGLAIERLDLGDLGSLERGLAALVAREGRIRHRHQQRGDLPSKPFEDFTLAELPGGAAGQCRGRRGLRPGRSAGHARTGAGAGSSTSPASRSMAAGPISAPTSPSKAALVGLTRAWAREFGAYGITVNAIAPGAFPTDAEKIHPDPEGYTRFVLDHQARQAARPARTTSPRRCCS